MNAPNNNHFASIEDIQSRFEMLGYICSRSIATAIYVAYSLGKPILAEGPAGVGKTELAKTAADVLGVPLIRLQCYEGLDDTKALYEWKYGKQLLYTQLLKDKLHDLMDGATGLKESINRLHQYEDIFFSEHFLEPRPLLNAMRQPEGSVLLIDEIDKSDQEFEAMLLEVLSDFQVTVPEIGTITAQRNPFVILTSNNNREVSDALKRRCLHLYIGYPEVELEKRIVRARVPDIPAALNDSLVRFVQNVRELEIKKHPSISETIDWARTLMLLNAETMDEEFIRDTINVILKFEDDIEVANRELENLLPQSEALKDGTNA
ncbi:MAG TPA: ATPase [Gammaproteobacteria bacterium]|nr:ATPase [Gammaproteobacteria bacterium]